eukprot:2116261-Prymnesium_polylepis.2
MCGGVMLEPCCGGRGGDGSTRMSIVNDLPVTHEMHAHVQSDSLRELARGPLRKRSPAETWTVGDGVNLEHLECGVKNMPR